MVGLNNRHRVGGFDGARPCSDVKHIAVWCKAARYEVHAGIVSHLVRRIVIDVDPATAELVPQFLSGNVFDELRFLKISFFLDEMKDSLNVNVEDV